MIKILKGTIVSKDNDNDINQLINNSTGTNIAKSNISTFTFNLAGLDPLETYPLGKLNDDSVINWYLDTIDLTARKLDNDKYL